MILVTVGSQKFQFNRLLKEVDKLIEEGIINEKVFAQIGVSDYKPNNYKYTDFLKPEDFSKKLDECDLVITHAGTGAIINAIKKGKKVIGVPRLAKYGEHVDDHQFQIIKEFNELKLIEPCYEIDKLKKSLEKVKNNKYNKYISNTNKIINNIMDFIDEDD